MPNALNIGLVGSGFMGQAHADAYRRAGILYRNLPRTPVLYAIADQNESLAESARRKLGFAKAYGDWQRLVEDPDVHVVDITTPNHLHVEVALAAIEAGKHVYCEKPMAVKVEDAQRMAAAAKKSGVQTLVAFNNVKTPAALVAKQIIERGEIGEPVRFRGRFDQGSQVPQYAALFGFDFAGGGLGYFDIKVFEVHDLIQGIGRGEKCFPDFEFGARNQEILEAIDQSSRSGAWVSTRP
jgi:predicted dehydrogenase